jgi:predicted dehydrogenase
MGRRHVRAVGQAGGRVVATVDPTAEPVEGFAHFASVDEALAAVDVDAAVVAAPTSLHAAVGRELLERGVATLIEKPLGATADEARGLVALARERDAVLAVGHVERFNPAVRLVRELLRSGRVGRPIAMTFRRVGLPPAGPPDADVIHDLAVHDVDVFALLCGACPDLVGATGWPATGLAESAQLLLAGGGISASVQVNWRTPVRLREFTVTTDERYLEINYTTQTVEVVEPVDLKEFEEFAPFQTHYGSARRVRMECVQAEPLLEEMRAFLSLVEGGDPGPLAVGADGLCAIDIADRASAVAAAAAAEAAE